MPDANIRIDQSANPQPAGVAGQARKDLILGQPVTLRNGDDTDVCKWLWQLLDVPIGSTAVLSATSGPVTVFTPDVAGSYRIQLTINDNLAGQRQIKIAAVVDANDFVYPAAGQQAQEANWPVAGGGLNELGWAKEVELILRQLAAGSGGGAPELYDYSSTGVFETIKDLDVVEEDTVVSVEVTISAGSGAAGVIFSSQVQLRGTARRAAGGVLAVNSAVLTQGNLPGDSAQLAVSGNRLLVQFVTTRIDVINVGFIVRMFPVDTPTA